AMSNQKITGLAAPAAQNDAVRADANLRAPDSSALEGSNKAAVQNHTPKAHTLGSHSTKAHTELTGVTSDQHHGRSHDHSIAGDGSPIAVAGVPNLPASKITSLRFPVDRLPALTNGKIWHGTGGNVEEISLPSSYSAQLTVAVFQMTPATGDMVSPERINNITTAAEDSTANAENKYAQVLFFAAARMTQFRLYGHDSNNNDGAWKLQYLDEDYNWNDWKTGIVTGEG
ncbi:unnamed protein product, partial [marine sediment metagenome]